MHHIKNKMATCRRFFAALVLFFINFSFSSSTFRKNVFSTKTAYRFVQNYDIPVGKNSFVSTKLANKHCAAVHTQVVLRHGARFPGYKDIRKMSHLHKKLKLIVTNSEFSFLNTWENEYPESHEKTLVDEGEEEHFALGSRFAHRLAELFGESVKNVKFISSSKDRSLDSAKAFYEGFTEAILHEALDDLKPEINDQILRFHTTCRKFIDTVENNKTYLSTYNKFKRSPEMLQVAENVKQRLGIEHADLDAGELKLIYFLCTFEMIIFEREDWCHMMTHEDRQVLEYHNDLKQYWKKAYGHQVIGNMACPLVNQIFTSLDKAVNKQLNNVNKRGDVAAFYFGHAETLAPLYAALGLFNDTQPLLATNFQQMKDRQFRSSKILPFSANIALILYKCDYTDQPQPSIHDYVLRVYVNEEPVTIPACDGYVCPYKQVRDSLVHHIDKCDFAGVCNVNKHDEL